MSTPRFMDTTPTGASVVVLSDPESLSLAAATIIVAHARWAVKSTGRFTIALSGGSTPEPVYALLAERPFVELVPWQDTHVFWGDERCVDHTDPRSNERMAREILLDHVPIAAERVHPMRCARGGLQAADAEAAARRAADEYEALLRHVFGEAGGSCRKAPTSGGRAAARIDLTLLGIGENGHTASLFPGSDVLDERRRWAAAAHEDPETAAATSGTGERLWRVTMTAPFINLSGLALFVVSGATKAEAVRQAVEGDADPHVLPARLVRPAAGRLVWLLDEGAASRLRGAPAAERAGAGPRSALPEYPGEPESFDDLEGCDLGPSR